MRMWMTKPVLWICGAMLLAAPPASATIHYRVSLAHPEQHMLHVEMTVQRMYPGMRVALPAWNALYQVRDFSSRVQDVEASAKIPGGAIVKLVATKMDKDTWRMDVPLAPVELPATTELAVRYAIYWDDAGPFNSQLNTDHAFLNLAEVLFYVPERRKEESHVEYTDIPDGWKLAVELPAGDPQFSEVAPSYDALVDAPVELGRFEDFRFQQGGAGYRVVVASGPYKQDQLEEVLKKIVATETEMMGGAPFSEYTFFFHFGPYAQVGGGGMEHLNSTAISAPSGEYAAGVAAHEFFHLWNVKRIRPQSLEPVDYTQEQYTRALWFCEGVTSTYGAYTLERSGLWSEAQFYNDLAGQIAQLESRPAREWKSVEESSLDAWLEKYDLYNRADFSISYYNKGQSLGEMLDLAIRDATDNHGSLDEVMRGMNRDYARQGKFYDDSQGIREEVEKVTGRSFQDFFQKYVAGTEEIPWNDFLWMAGLRLDVVPEDTADAGFTVGRGAGTEIVVDGVETGSSAARAGLSAGDELLLVDGATPPRRLDAWTQGLKAGQTIELHVKHMGAEQDVKFQAGSSTRKSYRIEALPGNEKQKRIREGWLKGKTE
jgi:predicted metalloprotease with PDZ domain